MFTGVPRADIISIDGVLYQGKEPIAGAGDMLQLIRDAGVRYVFLTNGGGGHEDAKVASLAKRLQLPDDNAVKNRMIVSHTPMRGWDDKIKKNGTVLITGSHPETARQVALEYDGTSQSLFNKMLIGT